MKMLFILLIMISATAYAEVNRDEAGAMIDEMVKSNTISKEEGEKAKARLFSMNSHEWDSLNAEAEAKEKILRAPASAQEQNPDLNKEQLQAIHSDLSVIAPHYVSDK